MHNLALRWGEDQEVLLSKVVVPQLVLSSKDGEQLHAVACSC